MVTDTLPVPPLRPVETLQMEDQGRHYLLLRDPYGYSEKMIAIAVEAAPLLALMDGHRTFSQIIEEFERMTGHSVEAEEFKAMLDLLEGAYLLETADFQKHRVQLEDEYREKAQRSPALSGSGYPSDPAELAAYLDGLLSIPADEDMEPEELLENKTIRGLLLPHIDLHRGGSTYGRGYQKILSRIDDFRDPLLVGIIGVAHQGSGYPIVASTKDFVSPLGALKSDRKALDYLKEKLGDRVFQDEWVHRSEHSVELQAVWLQHIFKGREITIMPMASGIISPGESGTPRGNPDVELVVKTLKEIEKQHEGSVLWVASVDFAHVGLYFGDQGYVDDKIRTETARLDMEALDAVRASDADVWWKSIMLDDNKRRICGLNATYLVLRLLEGTQSRVIDYQQAVSEKADQMVTFAASIFQEK